MNVDMRDAQQKNSLVIEGSGKQNQHNMSTATPRDRIEMSNDRVRTPDTFENHTMSQSNQEADVRDSENPQLSHFSNRDEKLVKKKSELPVSGVLNTRDLQEAARIQSMPTGDDDKGSLSGVTGKSIQKVRADNNNHDKPISTNTNKIGSNSEMEVDQTKGRKDRDGKDYEALILTVPGLKSSSRQTSHKSDQNQ